MRVTGWQLVATDQPLFKHERTEQPGPNEVLVKVAGCGVCHTDLGFAREGVPTKSALPITLGHEVSGRVVEAGPGAETWLGRAVIVPAVLPCGTCGACRDGRAQVCPKQVFPGSDTHGGFATHVRVPARGLCPVPEQDLAAAGLTLPMLAVVADAVTTPYQAVHRSGLSPRDLAIFVGAGGVGGFGIQIAAAVGAPTIAVDVDEERLELARSHGASLTIDARLGFKAIKAAVRQFADEREVPTWRWRIFETSGTAEGQGTAFGLLGPGGYLSVVGFTAKKIEIKFSNLMAFDATAQGNWGCVPELYPGALALVLSGKVKIADLIEMRPLETVNDVLDEVAQRGARRRIVLVP